MFKQPDIGLCGVKLARGNMLRKHSSTNKFNCLHFSFKSLVPVNGNVSLKSLLKPLCGERSQKSHGSKNAETLYPFLTISNPKLQHILMAVKLVVVCKVV